MTKDGNQKSYVKKMVKDIELHLNPGSKDGHKNTKKLDKAEQKLDTIKFTKSPFLISIFQGICVFTAMSVTGFYILYWRYDIQLPIAACVSLAIASVVAIAFALSLAVRCVTALCATKISGQQGRIILLSVITSLVIGGPVVSIMYNINQASVTISCTADLAEKYGRDMVAAYQEAYDDMTNALIENVKVWQKITDGIQTALEPIRSGLKSVEKKFEEAETAVKEAAGNCRRGISEAYDSCAGGANNAYDECRRKVPSFGDIINKPKDFFTGIFGGRKKRDINDICKSISVGSAVCEPLKQIDVCKVLDVPKTFVLNMLSSGIGLFGNFAELFNFKLSVDSGSSGQFNSSTNETEIKQRIRNKFEEKYSTVLYVVFIARIIFLLPIFVVPISCALYLRKYRKCDTTGKSTKFAKQQKKRESSYLVLQIIQLITHILFSLTIICFDHTLFWIESVLKENGNATFTAEGEVKLAFESEGGPVLKPLIDQFITTFALKRTQNFTINTDRCLPEPMNPSSGLSFVIPVLAIYVCAFVFVFTEFYIANCRPSIVNY